MRTIHALPALTVAILFATGILLGGSAVLIPSTVFLCLTILFLLAVGFFFLAEKDRRLLPVRTLLLLLLVVGAGVAKIQFDSRTGKTDAVHLESHVTVVGRVVEPPTRVAFRTRFVLETDSIMDASGNHLHEIQILVTLTQRKKDSVTIPVLYGATLRLKGQLTRPSAERNPGEFDARNYYEAQGIKYLMRVRGHGNAEVLDSVSTSGLFSWVMKHAVVPVRSYLIALIDRTIGGDEGELLKGVFVGERSGIAHATREAFAHAGISHLLAVSGAHVAIVWGILATIFGLLRLPRTMKGAAILGSVLLYMLLTGSNPPIVRATIMGAVLQIGKMMGVKSSGLNSLGVAALLILGYDARQLFDVGFQLSFVAVFSLIYLFPLANAWLPAIRTPSWWRTLVVRAMELSLLTLVATVGTLPLIAVYFGKVSVVGLLTNIVVVPAVGFSIFLGLVSALVGWLSLFLAESFAALNMYVLKLILWTASSAGDLRWAYIDTLQFRPIHALPFYAAVGVLFHLHLRSVA